MKKPLITISLLAGLLTHHAPAFAQVPQNAKYEPCSDMGQIIDAEMKALAAKRNLEEYEKLGPLCHELLDSPDANVESKVEGFIWHHWKEQRRGFVVATVHSLEALPTTFFIFIEPDIKGKWRVDWHTERILFDGMRDHGGFTAYSVRCIPEDENHPIDRLKLKDKRGKLIGTIW
jgi:hypothetical protein